MDLARTPRSSSRSLWSLVEVHDRAAVAQRRHVVRELGIDRHDLTEHKSRAALPRLASLSLLEPRQVSGIRRMERERRDRPAIDHRDDDLTLPRLGSSHPPRIGGGPADVVYGHT